MTKKGGGLTKEEIDLLRNKVGKPKYERRHNTFITWLTIFEDIAKGYSKEPDEFRYLNGLTVEEIATYLNYRYWSMIEGYIRTHTGDKNISHYKIAATCEYIIISEGPFENKKGEALIDFNADFAFFVSLQILFAWNKDKEGMTPEILESLFKDNTPTQKFVKEHKLWLRYMSKWHQAVIFSNMQTLRLFHYWLKGTRIEDFAIHE